MMKIEKKISHIFTPTHEANQREDNAWSLTHQVDDKGMEPSAQTNGREDSKDDPPPRSVEKRADITSNLIESMINVLFTTTNHIKGTIKNTHQKQ